ncbi:MAG: DUF2520 domain-containing protein [Polyangiaceae bacterium]
MSLLARGVFVFGAGKVGRALAAALRRRAIPVTLRAARRGWPSRPLVAGIVVVAVRDGDVPKVAARAAELGVIPRTAVCVHVAGALDADALAPLRGHVAGVAQMHPMISFASTTFVPDLSRGHVHVRGDAVAERAARTLARSIGMVPRTFPRLDTIGYHASAGLVANGAAALAASGVELLVRSGVPREDAPKMLGPLLRSVAENVEHLGLPSALTGPVRRGDPGAVARHLTTIEARLPSLAELYVTLVGAQVPIAKRIGEAPPAAFDALETWVRKAAARARRRGRP